jgi:hypothetical protein
MRGFIASAADNPEGAKDPQRWIQLARYLVGLCDQLLDEGDSDEDYAEDYKDPARDKWLTFDDVFGYTRRPRVTRRPSKTSTTG